MTHFDVLRPSSIKDRVAVRTYTQSERGRGKEERGDRDNSSQFSTRWTRTLQQQTKCSDYGSPRRRFSRKCWRTVGSLPGPPAARSCRFCMEKSRIVNNAVCHNDTRVGEERVCDALRRCPPRTSLSVPFCSLTSTSGIHAVGCVVASAPCSKHNMTYFGSAVVSIVFTCPLSGSFGSDECKMTSEGTF